MSNLSDDSDFSQHFRPDCELLCDLSHSVCGCHWTALSSLRFFKCWQYPHSLRRLLTHSRNSAESWECIGLHMKSAFWYCDKLKWIEYHSRLFIKMIISNFCNDCTKSATLFDRLLRYVSMQSFQHKSVLMRSMLDKRMNHVLHFRIYFHSPIPMQIIEQEIIEWNHQLRKARPGPCEQFAI